MLTVKRAIVLLSIGDSFVVVVLRKVLLEDPSNSQFSSLCSSGPSPQNRTIVIVTCVS